MQSVSGIQADPWTHLSDDNFCVTFDHFWHEQHFWGLVITCLSPKPNHHNEVKLVLIHSVPLLLHTFDVIMWKGDSDNVVCLKEMVKC